MTVWGTIDNADRTIRCQTWQEVEDAKLNLDSWSRVTDWIGGIIEVNE